MTNTEIKELIYILKKEGCNSKKQAIEYLEKKLKPFKIGDRIRIIKLKGEDHYNGREGVIEYIDDLDQLHGTWGGLAIIPSEDLIKVINVEVVEN